MQRLKDFWNSGAQGKAILIGVPAAVILCCLCALAASSGAGASALLTLLMPGAPTATATVTVTAGTATGSAEPTLTETGTLTTTGTEATASPQGTSSITPVGQQPSATARPTAVPPSPTPIPPKAPSATPKPAPAPTATPAPAGYTVISLTSPIITGQDVTLTIKTVPNSACNLTYITPQGVTSNAPGLGATTANAQGICSWTWKITPGTKPGTGKLYITAGGITGKMDITIQ